MKQTDLLVRVDASGSVALRDQICEQISAQIFSGQLRPGQKLPSCRRLATTLGVAKNTVLSAYQLLIQDGHIVAREKSGYFVAIIRAPVTQTGADAIGDRLNIFANYRIKNLPSKSAIIGRPKNWHDLPYPFVCNQLDRSEFPLSTWRKCGYEALGWSLASVSTSDHIYEDYDVLIDQIMSRLLPRRGVIGQRDNLLLTSGAQHAIYIVATLLAQSGRTLAMEDPGYPDARNIFRQMFGEVALIPLDGEGIRLEDLPKNVGAIYLTPNQQFPLGFAMSKARRRALLDFAVRNDVVIIEDDYDGAIDLSPQPLPALFSQRPDANIIYIGSLSKSIAPGIRLGYIVSPPEFAREARVLRGMMLRHPPPLIQIMAAQFIRLGHFEARTTRLKSLYSARLDTLDKALQKHLPSARRLNATTGSTAILEFEGYQLDGIEQELLKQGVVVDALGPCYAKREAPRNVLRLGVSAIATNRIDRGVGIIAEHLSRRR